LGCCNTLNNIITQFLNSCLLNNSYYFSFYSRIRVFQCFSSLVHMKDVKLLLSNSCLSTAWWLCACLACARLLTTICSNNNPSQSLYYIHANVSYHFRIRNKLTFFITLSSYYYCYYHRTSIEPSASCTLGNLNHALRPLACILFLR
jgi:hypothetical protein